MLLLRGSFKPRLVAALVTCGVLLTVLSAPSLAAPGDPNIISDTSSVSLTNPASAIIEVYSDDLPFGAHDVSAISSDDTVATIESNGPTTGNIAAFTVTSLSRGMTNAIFSLTVTNDDGSETHYNDLRIKVTVAAPAIISLPDALTGMSGAITTAEISSVDMPFVPGTVIHAESVRSAVASIESPDIEASDDGTANFSIQGLAHGSGSIRFSAAGYTTLTVTIVIGEPALVVDRTSIDVVVGGAATVNVFSTDAPLLDPGTVTFTSSRDGVVEISSGPGDTPDTARFTLTGLTAGPTTIVFRNDRYSNSVSINVNVSIPTLALSALPETILAGSVQTFEVTSADAPLSPDLALDVQSSNENVVTLSSTSSPENGVAVVTLQIEGIGVATVTVNVPGYVSRSVVVAVSTPTLASSDSAISVFAGGTYMVSVTCPDNSLEDGAVVKAIVDNGSVASTLESISSLNGVAEFEISGLEIGQTTVHFSSDNYRDSTVRIQVVRSQLISNSASFELFVGETKVVSLSSNDVAIGEGTEFSTLLANDNISVGDPIYQSDGTVDFLVTGLSEGSSNVNFSSDKFRSVPVSTRVKSARLTSETNNLRVYVGGTQQIQISSTDLTLKDEAVISGESCDDGNVEITSLSPTFAGTTTVTLTGTSAGVCVLRFSADNYQTVRVSVTVVTPKLTSSSTAVTMVVGETLLIALTSDDLVLADDVKVSARSSISPPFLVDANADAQGGAGTFVLIGKSLGRGTIRFSALGYQNLTVLVVVVKANAVGTKTPTKKPTSGTTVAKKTAIGSAHFSRGQFTLSYKQQLLLNKYVATIKAKKYTHVTLTGFTIYVAALKNQAAGIREMKIRFDVVRIFLAKALPKGTTIVIVDGTKTARKGFINTQAGRNEYRRVDITAGK